MVTIAGEIADQRVLELRIAEADSCFGRVSTAESQAGVVFARLGGINPFDLIEQGFRVSDQPQSLRSCEQLVSYLNEEEELECPVLLFSKRAFFKEVWRQLPGIPRGKTVGYGQLAAMAGSPLCARGAGAAMAANPLPFFLPCHRVIMADGRLGGYGGREDIKRALLEREGVIIRKR